MASVDCMPTYCSASFWSGSSNDACVALQIPKMSISAHAFSCSRVKEHRRESIYIYRKWLDEIFLIIYFILRYGEAPGNFGDSLPTVFVLVF